MTVSTHVLDASAGQPAAGVAVALSRRGPDGGWLSVESGTTDADGRQRFAAPTPPGMYRLVFGTGRYFAARAVATFYPEVTIAFTIPEPAPVADAGAGTGTIADAGVVADAGVGVVRGAGEPAPGTEAHFHVPLLLSPFAYSTYRGS